MADPTTLLTDTVSWLFLIFGVSLPIILIIRFIGLTGFQELTRFESYTTFYYRLNPLTKIAFTLVVTIVAASTIWWIGAAIAAVLLLSYLSLQNGRRKLLLGFYLVFATMLGSLQGLAPYTPPEVIQTAFGNYQPVNIWTWPDYFAYLGFIPTLSLQAVLYSLQVSMRTVSVVISALLLVMTSTPSEILRSLNRIGLPIPIVFALIVAMRSIPRVFDSLDLTIKSQFMRGLGSQANRFVRPFYYIPAGFASIIPVLVFMLRGARNTAISADTRAFRAYNTRTYLMPSRFGRADGWMLLVIVLMVCFATAAILLGFGRSIPYVGV